jgi:ABC-type uncharacterized transport system fused permease/ATPase subunit
MFKYFYKKKLLVASIIILTSLLLFGEFLIYKTGIQISQYYKVLLKKDSSGFVDLLYRNLGLYVGLALVLTISKFLKDLFILQIRTLFTVALLESYNKTQIVWTQSISRDTLLLSQSLYNILQYVTLPFTIGYYTYETILISSLAPVIIYVYFIITTLITCFLSRKLVPLINSLEQSEAEFRFSVGIWSEFDSFKCYERPQRQRVECNYHDILFNSGNRRFNY